MLGPDPITKLDGLNRRWTIWAEVIVLLGIAIGLRVFNFYGFYGSDDSNYLRLARTLADGGDLSALMTKDARVFGCRVGTYAPVAGFLRCVPSVEIAMVAYPFVMSLVGVLAVWWAGRTWLGGRTGLGAGLLLAGLPMETINASQLLPDLPGSVWAFLGIMLIEGARRADRVFRPMLGSMLGGALLGLGWLCKETIVYIVLVVFLYWIGSAARNPKRWRTTISAGAGFGLILLVEMIAYWRISGDALFRFHVTEANFALGRSEFALGVGGSFFLSGQWGDLLDRLFVSAPKLFFLCPYYGGIFLIGSMAAVCAIVKRWKPYSFVVFWFTGLLLLFDFGPIRLYPYQPAVLFDRYLYPLFYPAVLVSAGVIRYLWIEPVMTLRIRWGNRLVAGMLTGVLLGGYAWGFYFTHNKAEYPATVRSLARQMDPQARVYSDPTTLEMIRCYWNYPSATALTDFNRYSAERVDPGSYVLVNRVILWSYRNLPRYAIPDFCDRSPEGWIVRHQSSRCVLYFVPKANARE
jgi:hypothetical protein